VSVGRSLLPEQQAALVLREVAERAIGSVADFHYSFMGAPWPSTRFEPKARELASLLARDRVDAAVLIPV